MFYYDGVGMLVDPEGFARQQAYPSVRGAASRHGKAPCSLGYALPAALSGVELGSAASNCQGYLCLCGAGALLSEQ